MTSALIRHAGDVPLTITVTPAHRDQVLEYLDLYLPAPAGDREMNGYHFTVHTDPVATGPALATWASTVDRTITPVPGVTLSETVNGKRRRYTLLADALEQQPGTWAVQITDTTIDLYTNEPDWAPRYLLRLIREVMLRTYENTGGIVFHAAGLDLPGGAVMICGPQGAGKTTTMAAILAAAGERAALLSNDRLIWHGHRRLVAVPLPVPLARGTLEAFPALTVRSPVPVSDLSAVFGTRDKTVLPARTFATAFGAGLVASGSVRALIVPRASDTDQPPLIEQLDPDTAQTFLTEACFTPTDEFWSPWLVARTRSDHELATVAGHACAHLAQTLPCYRVSFGIHHPARALTGVLIDLIGGL